MSNSTNEQGDGGAELQKNPILRVANLSIAFGGLQALTDISFNVSQNDILGLIGPNGAGKTVLLNCINCIYKPQHGKILLEELEITGLPRHKLASLGMARTFQNIELFKQMNVIDNTIVGTHHRHRNGILKGGLFWGPGKREEVLAREKAEEVIDFLELYPYRKRMVSSLSYGVQKLVGLARALALEPKILLLDEIASGLNREEREDLARFILRIRYEKNIPIIWVEHDMELITQITNRMLCITYGVKIAEGTPAEVTSQPKVVEAYLGKQ